MQWQNLLSSRTRHMRRSAVREMLKLTSRPDMISLAGGLPDPSLFPADEIRAAADRVLTRHPAAALQYGETEGLPALRDWLASRASRPGFRVNPDNVLIVTGSQQAIDLLGKVFLDPGDRVLVENPTYLALLSAWRPWEVDFLAANSDAEGLRVEDIALSPRDCPKLAYVVPNFQNPQGTTLDLRRREQLVALARQRQFALIEDDPYGLLRFEGEALPSLLDLDAREGREGELDTNVIQLGTFSKVLTPGLRVAWVIAERAVIDRLVQAKQSADLHTSTLCQHIVLELAKQGVIERQLPRLREAYRQKRDTLNHALRRHLPAGTTWTSPAGGMFLLASFPRAIEAREVLPRALELGVAFVPGDDFHLHGTGRHTLRLNFSHPSPDRLEEGARRLGQALAEQPSSKSWRA
jgi:2-aminoadipate transaminase